MPPPATAAALVELSLDDWQAYVQQHSHGTPLHHRRWIELLADYHRLKFRGYGWQRDRSLVAAVPFLETPRLFGGRKLISLPFSDCVTVLAADGVSRDHFLSDLYARGPFHSYREVIIRSGTPHSSIPRSSTLYRHEIATDVSWERAYAAIDRRAHQNIRRARAAGLRYESTVNSSAVDFFFALQLETRRKHGLPAQPLRFFQQLQQRIVDSGLGFWGLVWCGDEAAAAGLLLDDGQTLICKYAASNPRLLHLRPNHLLFAELIDFAVRGPHVTLDLGSSREQDTGLRRFKRQLGARELPLHYLMLKGQASVQLSDGACAGLMKQIIRHGPRWVAKSVGRILYRYSQ